MKPVTVYTVCYGLYDQYLPRWFEFVCAMDPAPVDVVVVTDRAQPVDVRQVIAPRRGRWPYSTYLNDAVAAAKTDHVAAVDVDDEVLPDALADTNFDVDVFVWGLQRSDGLLHMPTCRSAQEVLALDYNPYNHGSVHTVDIWRRAGGYRDIAYSDWGFFVDCARVGATFATSNRPNYRYWWHPEESVTGILVGEHDRHAAEVMNPQAGRPL